jgi:hypothetical protein
MDKNVILHNVRLWLNQRPKDVDYGIVSTDTMIKIVTPDEYKNTATG